MDEKHRETLETHRAHIAQSVDPERLLPLLQKLEVLTADDVASISTPTSNTAKVEKLFDVLPSKGIQGFQGLFAALDESYPFLLAELSGRSEPRSQEMYNGRKPQGSSRFSSEVFKASGASGDKPRDYDWLKTQCDNAIAELQSMKKQHAETMTRCDQAVKEADLYRKLYKDSIERQRVNADENHSLKVQLEEAQMERQAAEEELRHLQKLREEDKEEMTQLRAEQRKVVHESGSSEVLNKMYDSAMDKYEGVKRDFDDLQQRYSVLVANHNATLGKVELLKEDNRRLLKQYQETSSERDSALMECKGLKQQCTAAIRNWNEMRHEVNLLKEAYANMTQQRDKYMCDISQLMSTHLQSKNQNEMLAKELDSNLREYQLVMSERDTVHKEIEQLQDKLNDASGLCERLGAQKKDLEAEVETLRREVAQALQERDKYKKEVGEMSGMKQELEYERSGFQREFHLLTQERDQARKERHEALEQMDLVIKETQKEKLEEIDHVTKETELLRKQVEKSRLELQEALQEADVAKRRRDWAFGERDKIVQERESIRVLCDNLRRQRDQAVSELAQALRDSDDLKKQKNETHKELKETKEKYDSMVEREARKTQLNAIGHNHSRDSAIDADLQEWETETLEIELEAIDGDDFGFDLVGGRDDPQFPNDTSIFVCHVSKGGTADGKLKVNDILLKVNNTDMVSVDRNAALQAIRKRKHSNALSMVVRRRKATSARVWQPLQLVLARQKGKDPGIQIEQGLFISHVCPGGVIARDGMLPCVGDRIVNIKSKPAESLNSVEAMKLLEHSSEPVLLDIWRQASPLHSAGSSPTPTSQSALSSPLPDHSLAAACMSKSDVLPMRASTWDTSMDSSRSVGSNKNLRSSSSKTDSLDSQSPTPRKGPRGGDERNRYSIPVIDKAHEFVDRWINRRHKTQDRSHDPIPPPHVHHHHHQDVKGKSSMPGLNAGPMHNRENVIIEFDADIRKDEAVEVAPEVKRARKRELEVESNSGTWPKSRTHSVKDAPGSATVMNYPGQRRVKDRPSVQSMLFEAPPLNSRPVLPVEKADKMMLWHESQNSDTSMSGLHGGRHLVPSKTSPLKSPSFLPRSFPMPTVIREHSKPGFYPPAHYTSPTYPKVNHSSFYPRPLGPEFHSDSYGHYMRPGEKQPGLKATRPTSAPNRKDNRRGWAPPPMVWQDTRPPHPGRPEPPPFTRPQSQEVPACISIPPFSGDSAGISSPTSGSMGSGLSSRSGHSYTQHPASSSGSSQQCGGRGPPLPPYTMPMASSSSHGGLVSPPYSCPLTTFPIFEPDIDKSSSCHLSSEPYSSPSPSQMSFGNLDRMSDDYPHTYNKMPPGLHPPSRQYEGDGHSTFPKRDRTSERFRIPSNTSMSAKSAYSLSDGSRPGSPMFPGTRDGSNKALSPLAQDYHRKKPRPRETRTIYIEKTADPVGFAVHAGPAGGIFVSTVSENSLAAREGLVVGDQLLEVCGINMRNATYEHALTVLRQCGDNLSMKVQYNPEKYREGHESSSNGSLASTGSSLSPIKQLSMDSDKSGTLTHNSPMRTPSNSMDGSYERPRFVTLKRSGSTVGVGFTIIGGNATGIFIREVQQESFHAEIQCGDQILEYNGIDFRSVIMEQAFTELSKPCALMRLLLHHNLAKFNKALTMQGDHFYIRTNFDRAAENEGELSFRKDDTLLVENSLYGGGPPGVWYSWLVDDNGTKLKGGTIPSRIRLDDDLVLRRSLSESLSLHDGDDMKGSRRGSGSTRRSFFRRKKHQRNNSKDSRDLGSFSDASLSSDSVPILDDYSFGYTMMERIEYKLTRPVIVLAPLADALINKLTSESPDKYCCVEPYKVTWSAVTIEQAVADGKLLDYWKRDGHYECIEVAKVKECCDMNIHCLLNVGPAAIDRLYRLKIYPIVLFVRHKNAKQIREVKDVQFMPEKLSNRMAKEFYECHQRLEQDFHHHFSAIVQGGNLAEMCLQIKNVISSEQRKAVWVPIGSL